MELVTCDRCGQVFIMTYHYLYKLTKKGKTHRYCSYTCWRACGGDS